MSPELKNVTSQDGRSKIPIYSKIATRFNVSSSNSVISGTNVKQPVIKSAQHQPIDKENNIDLKAAKSKLYK